MVVRIFLATALSLSVVGAAHAIDKEPVQLRFIGQTLANEVLLKDMLRNLFLFEDATRDCNSIELVEAEVLGPDFDPRLDIAQDSTVPTAYEKWQVTSCDKTQVFLIWHRPAEDGGTDFGTIFPFPENTKQTN
jgi:hypothetical protein